MKIADNHIARVFDTLKERAIKEVQTNKTTEIYIEISFSVESVTKVRFNTEEVMV